MSESKNYASRYIVDVEIQPTYVELGDPSRAKYYIDRSDAKLMEKFKHWFKSVFQKGVPGSLTVFEYAKHEVDGEIKKVIKDFLNLKADEVNTMLS